MTPQQQAARSENGETCTTCRYCYSWKVDGHKVYNNIRVGPPWRRRDEAVLVQKVDPQEGRECTRFPQWTDILGGDWHWCGEYAARAAIGDRP